MNWREQAACLDTETDLFFPLGNTGPAVAQIREAKEICNSCPVILTCLLWAVQTGADHGVWGGLSEDERRNWKRRQRTRRTAVSELVGR